MQPSTDGPISPATKISQAQNIHKNNQNPFPKPKSKRSNSQCLNHPKKNPKRENKSSRPSTPKKNSEETSPTSKQSKEDSKPRNYNKESFSWTLSETPSMLKIHKVEKKTRRKSLLLKFSQLQKPKSLLNRFNSLKKRVRRAKNLRNSNKNSS